MRRSRWTRGGFLALIVVAGSLLLSGCSFRGAEADLRFGWPTGITRQAERMRVLWTWSSVAALFLGVIVWGLIFWCCLRYRKRDDHTIPRQTKYNMYIELVCVTIPMLVIVGLFWRTVVVENYVNKLSKNPDVLVEVDAFKWNWQFQYHEVRVAGQEVQQTYSNQQDFTTGQPAQDSPLFLNTVGTSDEIPVLVIPRGQTVQFIEHSQDVIHSFWVPEFLFKRDVIPYGTQAQQQASGLSDNRFEITPTTDGSFVGRCAELCGTYHSQMNFEVRVVEPDIFAKYLAALKQIGPDDPARQYKALIEANVPGGGYATTTHPFNTNRTLRSATGG